VPFTCPDCGRTSHNPTDVRERYCGACHTFPEDRATAAYLERRERAASDCQAERIGTVTTHVGDVRRLRLTHPITVFTTPTSPMSREQPMQLRHLALCEVHRAVLLDLHYEWEYDDEPAAPERRP
jgi:hypothetical protein